MAYILLLLVMLIVSRGTVADTDDVNANVSITCASDTTGKAVLSVIADMGIEVYVLCQNNKTFEAPEIEEGLYKLNISYTGNPVASCVFEKRKDTETYHVNVELIHDTGVETILDSYRVMCSYNAHAESGPSVKELSESLVPPNQLQTHLGHQATSTFSMELQDIFGNTLAGGFNLGKKIRIFITMTKASENSTEHGFNVVHCDAVGVGSVKYSILRSGCGDGHVISSIKGFISDGLTAYSPYFRSFKLYGSDTVAFSCTFNTCSARCDADSCAYRKGRRRRRKRDGRHLGSLQEALDIQEEHTILTRAIRIMPNSMQSKTVPVASNGLREFEQSGHLDQEGTIAESAAGSKSSHTEIEPSNTSSFKSTSIPSDSATRSTPISIYSHLHKSVSTSSIFSGSVIQVSSHFVQISTKSDNQFASSKLTGDKIGAIIGCSSFLVMVGLFLCVTLFHIKQKNNIETRYKASRSRDLDSKTCLLAEHDV